MVEGRAVHSYEELYRIATSDKNKNKDIIVVNLLSPFSGG
jgi:hypothetical protein